VVEEALLSDVDLGEHPAHARPPMLALGKQHSLFYAGQGLEQLAHAHVHPVTVGLAGHQPGDQKGEHAVEDVHPDLLVGVAEEDPLAEQLLFEGLSGLRLGAEDEP
jgi:hypothetical protein